MASGNQPSLLNGGVVYRARVSRTTIYQEPQRLCTALAPLNGCNYVADAMRIGAAFYTWDECVQRVTEDIITILPKLWGDFVQAIELVAISVGSGALVGAAAMAWSTKSVQLTEFGALAGAEVGLIVALELLNVVGLGMLIGQIGMQLKRVCELFQTASSMAWESCGDAILLDSAGRLFAQGYALLLVAVFEGAVAYLLEKGIKAGTAELRKSPMGCKVLRAAEVHARIEKLGVTSTPRVRASLRKALDFYERNRKSGRWAALSEEEFEKTLSDQLPGIDWSQEVAVETWNVGEVVVGYRSKTAPYGDFVTKVGTPADRLGIGSNMVLDTPNGKVSVPREFIRYRVTKRVEVLRSRASGMAIKKNGGFPDSRMFRDRSYASGGGTQYLVPGASDVLEVVEPPHVKP